MARTLALSTVGVGLFGKGLAAAGLTLPHVDKLLSCGH